MSNAEARTSANQHTGIAVMQCLRIWKVFALLLMAALTPPVAAQIEPSTAQVNLYFPQLADGGPRSQQWQTSFVFLNPSTTSVAGVVLLIYNNDGSPLRMDFGSGANSQFNFAIPPQGTVVLRSRMLSSQTVTGWAQAAASIPVEGTVLFTDFTNGVAQFQVSAASTLPTGEYWSAANSALGIAVANVYNNVAVTLNVSAIDSQGRSLGNAPVTVGPLSHASFNLSQLIPSLPSSFSGSITINPQVPQYNFVAWTLNSDSGALSSLPAGNLRWPISQFDRIWLVYRKIIDAAAKIAPAVGTNLGAAVPDLNIALDPVLNAFASPSGNNGTVQINMATAELISDSESELAFIVAHELGHIVQYRTQSLRFFPNAEFDADEYGMLFALLAGYDPYAAAGALAKLSMASNDSSLVSQQFDNISGDLHGSFNNRIAAVYGTINQLCALPQATSFCASYKSVVHPHFPSSTPLSRSGPSR